MEALPPPSETNVAPPDHRLPSGRNKVERISEQTKGLFDDFTAWVELRLKLFQAEVQEKIQTKVNETVLKIAPVVVGALAGLFALVTLALFVGWWLGHPAWGFLTVTLLLLAVVGMLIVRKNRVIRENEEAAAKQNGETTE